jgi:cytochrome c biogenesis factor
MESGAYYIIIISLGLALAIPLIVLGIFLHRVRILKQSWKPILAKAIGAVLAWACLTFLMLNVDFIFVYVNAHAPQGASIGVTDVLPLLTSTFVYGLAGWGLCHWVGHSKRVAAFDPGLNEN